VGFHKLTAPPFLQPTPTARNLALKLFPTGHNPDLDEGELPSEAAKLLPGEDGTPLGSGAIDDPEEEEQIIKSWSKHILTHPMGAAGGTGVARRHQRHYHSSASGCITSPGARSLEVIE
jgi:hypothetical protein